MVDLYVFMQPDLWVSKAPPLHLQGDDELFAFLTFPGVSRISHHLPDHEAGSPFTDRNSCRAEDLVTALVKARVSQTCDWITVDCFQNNNNKKKQYSLTQQPRNVLFVFYNALLEWWYSEWLSTLTCLFLWGDVYWAALIVSRRAPFPTVNHF